MFDFFSSPGFVYIIAGETGSGKSRLAIEEAKKRNGEVINVDLSQIYSFLKIGTGQVTEEECNGVPHHLLGFLNSPQKMSIFSMRELVEEKILSVLSRGKVPFLVGGSHYFILSLLLAPFSFIEKQEDSFYKKSFDLDASFLFSQSLKKDERLFACPRFPYKILGLEVNDKALRNQRILKRIKGFFSAGWKEEVISLSQELTLFMLEKKFIGYPEIFNFFHNKEKDMKKLEDEIFFKTCQYAKRQRTFLRKLQRDSLELGVSFNLFLKD